MKIFIYLATILFMLPVLPLAAQVKNTDTVVRVNGRPISLSIDSVTLEKAITKIDKDMEKKPDDSQLYSIKATLLACQKKVDEAITAIDKAIDLNPDRAEFVGSKGIFYYLKDDTINAHCCFDKAIEMLDTRINNLYDGDYERINNINNKYYFAYLKDQDKEKYKNSLKAEFTRIRNEIEKEGTDNLDELDDSDVKLLNRMFTKEFQDAFVEQTVNSRDISKEGLWKLLQTIAAISIRLE